MLVDRAHALSALDRCLRAAIAGAGACVVIEAHAGCGKTALLDALERRARAASLVVCRTSHGPGERGSSLGVIRALLDALGDGPLRRDADVSTAASDVDARCRRLGAERPLALLVDDAHHADDMSLAVLAALARRTPDLPLLIAVAGRPRWSPHVVDLVGTFAGARGVVALEPGPLSAEGSARLVAQRLAGPRGPDVSRRLHEASGGNPWLLGELCRQVDVHGERVLEGAAPPLSHEGRIVLRRRLAELAPAERRVADALAVLDGPADRHDLAEIAGGDAGTFGAIHAALAAAGLCDDGWRFPHPVLAAAVRSEIPPTEREALHRAAAAVLIARQAPERRIADHLVHAGPARDGDVSATLRRAAAAASADGAPTAAAAYLERALAERAPDEDRAELLADLGLRSFHAGLPQVRDRLHEAIATGDDDARVEALTRLAVLQLIDPREESLALAQSVAPELGTAGEVAYLDALVMFPERRDERARRTLALEPQAVADHTLRRAVLAHHAWLGAETGEQDAAAVAGLALAAIDDDTLVRQAGERSAFHLCVRVLRLADRCADGADAIARLQAVASASGSERLAAAAGRYAAELSLRQGELATAEREASRALGVMDGLAGIAAAVLEILVDTLVERGALDDAAEVLAEHAHLWSGGAGWEAGVRHARARLLLASGEYEQAEREAREVGRQRLAHGRPNPAWTGWRGTLALALAHQARFAEAAAAAAEEVALARRFGAAHALGRALHAQCVAEPDVAARAALARAALDELADPGPLVRARLEIVLGDALVRSGARVEARAVLQPAFATADRLGACPDAAAARRLLVASGLRPRAAAVSGVEALTPRQRQICDLVAAGRANRTIAQELFLSIKTVETHLAGAYRKLGVSSRHEMPALLGATA